MSETAADRPARSDLRLIAPWTVLVALLVVPGLLGSLSSILAVAAALVVAAQVWVRRAGLDGAWRQPAMLTFCAAFIALAAVFTATASEPADVRFILNFLALPLAPAIYLMAQERPAHDGALLVALALVGAIASVALGLAMVAFLDVTRAYGLFGGPNLLPRVAVPLGFVAMGGALFVKSGFRVLFYLGPVAAIGVVIFTGSRGAALALLPLAVIATIALVVRRDTRRDFLLLVAAVVALLVATYLYAPGDSMRLLTTFSSIGDVFVGVESPDLATSQRQAMFAMGLTAFLRAPVLGYGWANLGDAAALANPEQFGYLAGTPFMFHNDVIDFAVAGGVVGLVAWLAILVAPLLGLMAVPRDGLRRFRIYAVFVLSSSFLVFGFTDMTLGYDLPTTLYVFLTALILGVRSETTIPASRAPAETTESA